MIERNKHSPIKLHRIKINDKTIYFNVLHFVIDPVKRDILLWTRVFDLAESLLLSFEF